MDFRKLVIIGSLAALCGYGVLRVVKIGRQADGAYLLPTGQYITPSGVHIEVNDRPLGMTLSPDGATLAVVTGSNFAPRAVHLISTARSKLMQSMAIGDSFAGVAFSPDGSTLYVGGGQNHDIKVFRRAGQDGFAPAGAVSIPGSAPSGLAISADGKTLVAALNLKHSIAIIDTQTEAVEQVAVSNYPYTVVLSADGKLAYVTNWGGRKPRPEDKADSNFPIVVDPRTGIPASGTISIVDIGARKVVREIEVGLHPSGMALHAASKRLYIANANSDSVTVLDTHTHNALGSINVRPFTKAPLGSSPNALAVSADGKTLYVANAANNAVAVVDVSKPEAEVRGYLPTGWYPTAVALSADQRRLFIASGYGFGSLAATASGGSGRSYKDRKGVVSIADVPAPAQLRRLTAEVMRNNHAGQPWTTRASSPRNPVPMNLSETSPIEHVFYVIKENRTYDQVFGDMPQGNGDPSLVHFGRDVTPNHHALAEQFVLLDNFYAPGDQSALGHRWCTQGYASDWIHKYGNARNDTNPMLFAPSDFLWDNAKAHGVSVRSYGERGQVTLTPANATWTDVYNDWKNKTNRVQIAARTPIAGLKDVYSPHYPGFSMTIPDQVRMDRFLEDFRKFERDGNLPRLTILLLPTDHTDGTAPGFPTPRAMVADNDLALGRLVEAISNSKYWPKSAVFVVEDDAQNGLDHVDGHRTVALAVSPFTRRKAVDSTFYTTINMYRTIEQILGLPPSNQFDLAAEPMFSVFSTNPDNTAYKAIPNRIPLDEMNPPLKALLGLQRQLAVASAAMDFEEPDAAPEDVLNRAIWHSIMGFHKIYPRGRTTIE
ncbi:MAG: bifunctional YncE family protein/alkaline phosphatase family protein [Bryobacterales bacterium]|nr:bifunctional YncE family protein/alkaline phosphatase family protein [Bryobacterales bacterium]